MRRILFTTLLAATSCLAAAQSAGLQWTRYIGGSAQQDDYLINKSVVDLAGNLYLAGKVVNGTPEGLVVKYNPNGNREWVIGIDRGGHDEVLDMIQTPDGVLVSLRSDDADTEFDFSVIRLNANGTHQWRRLLDFPAKVIMGENTVTALGTKNGNIEMVQMNNQGFDLWVKTHDFGGVERVNEVADHASMMIGASKWNGVDYPFLATWDYKGDIVTRVIENIPGEYTCVDDVGSYVVGVHRKPTDDDIIWKASNTGFEGTPFQYNSPFGLNDRPVGTFWISDGFAATSQSSTTGTDFLTFPSLGGQPFRTDTAFHGEDLLAGVRNTGNLIYLAGSIEVAKDQFDAYVAAYVEGTNSASKLWSMNWGNISDQRVTGITSSRTGDAVYVFGTTVQGTAGKNIFLNKYIPPPTAKNDVLDISDGAVTPQNSGSVLTNDTHFFEGEAVLVSPPKNGSIVLEKDGRFSYTRNPGILGPDSFTYKVNRHGAVSNVATAKLNVGAYPRAIQAGEIYGGANLAVTVFVQNRAYAGGATIKLWDDTSIINTPPSIFVPENQSSEMVHLTSQTVTSTIVRRIWAQRENITISAPVTFKPGGLASVSVTPTSVLGGTDVTGKVMLTGTRPTLYTDVTLTDNTSAIVVPEKVTVMPDATSATFTVATTAVSATVTRQIYAKLDVTTRSANLTLLAKANLASLSMSPSTVVGGTGSTGTVGLSAPAGAGGVTVTLADNTSSITTPPSVAVAAGASSGTFNVTTTKVTATATRQITASYNGVSKVANLTLTP